MRAMERAVSFASAAAMVAISAPDREKKTAAIPAITGKFELEYEGELKGADAVARDLIRSAVLNVAPTWLSSTQFAVVSKALK